MVKRKNRLSLLLILCSIGLLIVLQGLWLTSSYEKAFHDFNRESSYIFRNTVLALRDSLLERNIRPVNADSVEMFRRRFGPDSAVAGIKHAGVNYVNVQERGENISIYIATTGPEDSLRSLLKPLAAKAAWVRGQQNFIIKISPDTLDPDTITLHYRDALAKANIRSPFIIRHATKTEFGPLHGRLSLGPGRPDEPDIPARAGILKDTISTDGVHINPIHQYSASFPGIRGILLRNILPQILFSLFLTLITTMSFIVIFRGLRAQQRLMEIKNDFISNVTHELKTPVATVSVAIEALQKFHALDKPELTKEYLNIAQHELSRLTLMTDNILKTSVFEHNGIHFNPQKINIETIVDDVLLSMKLVFEKHRALVQFNKTGSDFVITGDASHLTNLVYNLLDNALKYSKGAARIAISLHELQDGLSLSVRDEGIGITPEYQKRIFEKFFRVPTGDIHTIKGYGLGLSYVWNVVEKHEGTIDLESTPGEGSVFKIVLPR